MTMHFKPVHIGLERLTAVAALGSALALAGCGEESEGGEGGGVPACVGAKCDSAEPLDDNEPAGEGEQTNFDGLREFEDPVAVWLADQIDDNGVLRRDYLDMLTEIAELQGCGQETIDSYVISDELVVDGGGPFPRIVNTVCSSDRTKADMAFFALSFPNAAGDDVDDRQVEMFSWDSKARVYRFYKLDPVEGQSDATQLTIEPAECRDCHGTASNIDGSFMHMLPIMNELAAPWEHWHAAPVSVNHVVPDAVKESPNYKRLAGEDSPFLKSAARLETTIRGAFAQRVAVARLRTRREKPANPDQAMALLRPLFCDEHLTYMTEDGSSGLLSSSAVVDHGFHSVYFAIQGVGWPWEWWNDRIMRLNPPGAPDAVNMMPVRGEAMVAYEKQLMASRGLKPHRVMQIRSLDWQNPTLSQFRCELWHAAAERVKANPPEVEDNTRNSHLFDGLVDEILTIVPEDHGLSGDLPERIAIRAGDDMIVSLKSADASLQELAQTLADGTVDAAECDSDGGGVCEVDIEGLGDLVEAHFKALELGGRDALNAERDRRGCMAKLFYPNQPFIPDLPDEDGCKEMLGLTDVEPEPEPDPDPETSEGGDPPEDVAGNCCEARGDVGCENETVQKCVCDRDSFCCESEWDDICVNEVSSFGCTPGCE